MTHIARNGVRKDFRAQSDDRRRLKRDAEDAATPPLIHAEDMLMSIVMRQNFDDNAAMLFNQQLINLSVAGDSLKNAALREQFRQRALHTLGRIRPKAEKRLSQRVKPPRAFRLKMELPFT